MHNIQKRRYKAHTEQTLPKAPKHQERRKTHHRPEKTPKEETKTPKQTTNTERTTCQVYFNHQ